MGTYIRSTQQCYFEWPRVTSEWLSKIFNDTKHRAASLRQQNFLLWLWQSRPSMTCISHNLAYNVRLLLYINHAKRQKHDLTSSLWWSHQQRHHPRHVIEGRANRVPSFQVISWSSWPTASDARSICRFQNELNLPTALGLHRPRYYTFLHV